MSAYRCRCMSRWSSLGRAHARAGRRCYICRTIDEMELGPAGKPVERKLTAEERMIGRMARGLT